MPSPRAAFALLTLAASCVAAPPDPDDDDQEQPVPDPLGGGCPAGDIVVQRCGAISSTTYLTLASHGGDAPHEVQLVDASTGSTCRVVTFPSSVPIGNVTSLASIETDVYFCASPAGQDRGHLTKVSLVDGSVNTATFDCTSTTAFGGKLVVLRDIGSPLQIFDNFADFGSPEMLSIPECGNRLGFGDNRLYSTFSQPNNVFAYDPDTKASSSFAMPQNTMGVFGLAAHDGALTILDGVPDTQFLARFSTASGAPVSSTPVGQDAVRLHGLTNTCSGTALLL